MVVAVAEAKVPHTRVHYTLLYSTRAFIYIYINEFWLRSVFRCSFAYSVFLLLGTCPLSLEKFLCFLRDTSTGVARLYFSQWDGTLKRPTRAVRNKNYTWCQLYIISLMLGPHVSTIYTGKTKADTPDA